MLRTITVAELLDLLQDENPDARVIVSTDYGDYHHTQQALPLQGELESVTVTKSAYSNSGFAIVDSDPDDDDDRDVNDDEVFLVLR